MSNIVPFDSKQLPAHIKAEATEGNEFGFSGGGVAITTVSIAGGKFTINSGGEKKILTMPNSEAPAYSIECVILNSAPKGGLYQKTFYAEGYVNGSTAKPTCHSVDGVSPHATAQEKQASKCALCPQNAVGSGATAQNPKAKACRASKVLAIAPAGDLTKPMLLRVPGASTLALKEFGEALLARGVKSHQVITKISFDLTKPTYPALKFQPIGFPTPDMMETIAEQRESDVVKVIIGDKAPNEVKSAGDEEFEDAPALPKAKAVPEDDDLPTKKVATVAVEKPVEAPKPKKAIPKAEVVEDAPGGLDKALDGLDFDD
jgi:hypothetical protein